MINPLFVKQLDLLDGILPARYSYATGGVVDIRSKDGCEHPGGELSVLAGQRDTLQPSLQYAGCDGQLSSYVSLTYAQSNTAFSSATPGPDPIHDRTQQGQAFGFFSYPVSSSARLSLLLSGASSNNQLPNVAGSGAGIRAGRHRLSAAHPRRSTPGSTSATTWPWWRSAAQRAAI